MDLFNNNYGPEEELLREHCEPMREYMDMTPIEVIHKILALYECKEECVDRCPEGFAPGNACSPFVDRGDCIGICVCEIGQKIIMDFLCFDFTAHVNASGDQEAAVIKAFEALETRENMTNFPEGMFVIGDFTSLRFFLAHMTMLTDEEKERLKTSFNDMLDNIGENNDVDQE